MVLTPAEVNRVFSSLQWDGENSGYRDNAAAARGTVDPDDTAADLASQGRIDGYDHEFRDPTAVLAADLLVTTPHLALSIVDLYDSSEAAQASLKRSTQDLVRFQGQDLNGVIITGVEQSSLPVLGRDSVIGIMNQEIVGFDLESIGTFVVWVRGPIVARVLLVSLGTGDLSAAAEALARQMDRRIDGVFAGEISATPIIPTPTALATGNVPGAVPLIQGFNLPAMLLLPEDLSEEAEIEFEGFAASAEGLPVYQRAIAPKQASMKIGTSTLSRVTQTAALLPSVVEAQGPIRVLQDIPIDVFKELVGRNFIESLGEQIGGDAFDNLTVGRSETRTVGDLSAAFPMRLETLLSDFDFLMLFFSVGQVSFQLVVTSPSGELVVDDVVSMAETIAERIVENSP